MTKLEFIKAAKNEKGLNIYAVKQTSSKINKGFKITYSVQLNPTTVSTQRERVFWNMSLREIANQFIY